MNTFFLINMSPLFLLNWLCALVGIVHVICMLSHLGGVEWQAMRPRQIAWEIAWRLGYAALGAGCAGVLAGPLYGYTNPPGWEVVVNIGWPTALIANYLKTHDPLGEA